MDHGEQDHTRCEELRQNDRNIGLQRARLVADERRERSQLERLRAVYAELHAKLVQLQSARATATLGSAIPGAAGGTAGTAALKFSIDIANIEPKVQDTKIKIAISEEKIAGFQQHHDRLNRIQAENAARMKNLNCALPS